MEKETLEETSRPGGFANLNMEEKGTLIRGEGSVGLVAGLVDNMKGMVGSRWSEDEKAKMTEATEEILYRQDDEFCVDLDGEKAVKMVAWIRTQWKTTLRIFECFKNGKDREKQKREIYNCRNK